MKGEAVTLTEWLQEKTFMADSIALLEGGRLWDIWELLLWVRCCMKIPGFGFGQMLRDSHVYEEGHWLVSEETGKLLYQIVTKPSLKVMIRQVG
jgi:hypothetical protein